MNERPLYFDSIRRKASERWDQLDADADLAAPWHQLFKQVQSPRHVVSELLQNADDAGAHAVTIAIEDDTLVFEHDGDDFTEDHFASLCRFGFSNKRRLHTIGFRGIGFKSTFSLGPRVELITPSLSVYFDQSRFTEPHWIERGPRRDGRTQIRVVIADATRRAELEHNLLDWQRSPISLLFFKNIRQVCIGSRNVRWDRLADGPVDGSEWMRLDGANAETVLRIRGDEQHFPEDAKAEIRSERMLGSDHTTDLPPCPVDIVVGMDSRLFVVLPTGVDTGLPFACNAPFIQDPARLKIKDPAISPTNRWLLRRAGELAARAMLTWVGNEGMSAGNRAMAYELLPNACGTRAGLEGQCGQLVDRAMREVLERQPWVLTEGGSLVDSARCIDLPIQIRDIWTPQEASAMFDPSRRPVLHRAASDDSRRKLHLCQAVEPIGDDRVLASLATRSPSKPCSWAQLLSLWHYVARHAIRPWSGGGPLEHRIVPVEGCEAMVSPQEAVRLGERLTLGLEADRAFLSRHLKIVDPEWLRFVAEQRRLVVQGGDETSGEAVHAADELLRRYGLSEGSEANKVIDRVAASLFSDASPPIGDCVRLAQIAAALGAALGVHARVVARDGQLRQPDAVLADLDGCLEALVPPEKRPELLLHGGYASNFTSCTATQWSDWIDSGRSGLASCPVPVEKSRPIWQRAKVEQTLRMWGALQPPDFPYRNNEFVLTDWDFDQTYWTHWESLQEERPEVWADIVERLMGQPALLRKASSAQAFQNARNGSRRPVTQEDIAPGWVRRLRLLPCLRDTRHAYRRPAELLRRTDETEPLLDVELFVAKALDKEATRPLLDLLGVRATPAGPERIVDCIRALATSDQPPAEEVERWYRRLDQLAARCSTEQLSTIRDAFRDEKLILSNDGAWASIAGIAIFADEVDVPGAPTVLRAVADLSLWRKLEVAERPTVERAIEWLGALPHGQRLCKNDLRIVKAILARHATRVWESCNAWLNLAGEWVGIDSLEYRLTTNDYPAWSQVHEWVKQKTADLRGIADEAVDGVQFSALRSLGACIDEQLDRLTTDRGTTRSCRWLNAVGELLSRVEPDLEEDTERIRAIARRLEQTQWQSAPGLEVTPYIDGTPAGTRRRVEVLWRDTTLYVDELSEARLAKLVPQEIARGFDWSPIRSTLDYAFERSPEQVRDYIEQNFTLSPARQTADAVESGGARALALRPAEAPHDDSTCHDQRATPAFCDSQEHVGGGEVEGGRGHEAEDREQEGEAAEYLLGEDEVEQSATDANADASIPARRRPRHDIIQQFAIAQGFEQVDEQRFVHPDGSWIARTVGDRFPWQRGTRSGEIVRCYWPRNHCLERTPLQIDADVWTLIDRHPDRYALVLESPEGEPVEVGGYQLQDLLQREALRIYPAAYRLVIAA